MTIEESINNVVLNMDMSHLTQQQIEWLHTVNSLAMWVVIARTQRKLDQEKAA